jgi:hypothetical protein
LQGNLIVSGRNFVGKILKSPPKPSSGLSQIIVEVTYSHSSCQSGVLYCRSLSGRPMRNPHVILILFISTILLGCGVQDTESGSQDVAIPDLNLTLKALPGFDGQELPQMITSNTGNRFEVTLSFGAGIEPPLNAGWELGYDAELCSPEQVEYSIEELGDYLFFSSDRLNGKVLLAIAAKSREISLDEQAGENGGFCRVMFAAEQFSRETDSMPVIPGARFPTLKKEESGLRIEWELMLEGDFNRDLEIGPQDLLKLASVVTDGSPGDAGGEYDLNGDGRIDQSDATELGERCGARLTGFSVERIAPSQKALPEVDLPEGWVNTGEPLFTAWDPDPGYGDLQYTVTPLFAGGSAEGQVESSPILRVSPPPGPVRGFRVEAGDGWAELHWWPPEERFTPSSYSIQRSVAGGEWELFKENYDETSLRIEEFESNDPLEFKVAALNEDGLKGPYSESRSYLPGMPPIEAPAQPACLSRLASILIEWKSRENLVHVIYRSESIGDPLIRIAEIRSGVANYDDYDVQSGGRYFYRLAAVNSSGNESPLSPPQAGRALEHRYPRLQQNLVFNGGFEIGGAFWNLEQSVDPREDWTYKVVSLGEAYTGDYAMGLERMEIPELESARPGPCISQRIKLAPNTDYRLGFHARAAGVSMVNSEIRVGNDRYGEDIVAGLDWELQQLSFRTPPDTAVGYLRLRLEKGDAIYLDDIRVEQEGEIGEEILVYPEEKPVDRKVMPGGITTDSNKLSGLFFIIDGEPDLADVQRAGAKGVVTEPYPDLLYAASEQGLSVIGSGDFISGILDSANPEFLPLALEFYAGHPSISAWMLTNVPSTSQASLSNELLQHCLQKDPYHPLLVSGLQTDSSKGLSGVYSMGRDSTSDSPRVRILNLSSPDCMDKVFKALDETFKSPLGVFIVTGWREADSNKEGRQVLETLESMLALAALGVEPSTWTAGEIMLSSMENGNQRILWGRNSGTDPITLTWSEIGVNPQNALFLSHSGPDLNGFSLESGDIFMILEKD